MPPEETINPRNQAIRWEDHHIQAESEILPAAMREPYVWLKTHLREDCHRDVDVLVRQFREHGVTTDKTNWSRILKGRWNIDPRGEECDPCISEKNFLESVKALREDLRVEVIRGGIPFVETSVFHTIRRFIDKKRRPDRVNRFGMAIGPTGTQKTASYKELARRDTKIKWMEAPENGSIKEFTIRLATKFGAAPTISYFSARAKLFANAGPEHCIIIDNTQNLVRDKKQLEKLGKETYRQPAYELMRALQDETDCVVIWSITPENEEQMFSSRDEAAQIYNEQFEGRCGGLDGFLRLPNYSPKADVVKIAEALGFKDADRNGDRLFEISQVRGRIRRYFEILQEAKDNADDDRQRPSINHIEQVVARLEEEAAKRAERTKFKPKTV